MYLSAERIAVAEQAIRETFEQTSIAWQAIGHWDTGDPGQARVPDGVVTAPNFLDLGLKQEKFQVTVVQANAPTPDSLLAEVLSATAKLAKEVDDTVLQQLYDKSTAPPQNLAAGDTFQAIVNKLIHVRAQIEDAGYRAPSCLFTNTDGLIAFSDLSGGYLQIDSALAAVNANSLYRATQIDSALPAGKKILLVLGRRQRIAYGGAPAASSGEEPADLAVSASPSLEVVGETAGGEIELAVRIRFVTRVKDDKGIVALTEP